MISEITTLSWKANVFAPSCVGAEDQGQGEGEQAGDGPAKAQACGERRRRCEQRQR